MVSFIRPNAAVMSALIASLASTEAAYGRFYLGSRPSMALQSRMLPILGGPSLFSRDIGRVMRDVDEMFDTMLGDMDDMLYEPLSVLPRLSRPSFLLQGSPVSNALVQNRATSKNVYGITQDDKQLQIVVSVPDVKASDIDLRLEEDGRVLRVSGEMKRESEGISVHSRFDRSFALPRNIDTNQISAQMEAGVLTISAPKIEETKENFRRIDIIENKKAEINEAVGKSEGANDSPSLENEESQVKAKPGVDESVIDLDVEKE